MSWRAQMLWLFFSLSGRIGPAAFLLAGLLLFIAQGYLLHTAPPAFVQSMFYGAPMPADIWDAPGAQVWLYSSTVFSLLEIWCFFALTVKRMHDFNRPTALGLIAVPLGFFLLPVLPFFRSDPGPNRFGDETNSPGRPRTDRQT